MSLFNYKHLPKGPLQETSKVFNSTANIIIETISPGHEQSIALRKLLESKDAAVRATLYPGK